MRYWLILLLLLAVSSASAQDDFSPGKPLLESVSIPLQYLAWSADSSTLWFEVEWALDESVAVGQGYAYDVTSEKLTELHESPFTATLDQEEQKYFQVWDVMHQSPYDDDIIFGSTVGIQCGHECAGQLIMAGEDWRGREGVVSMGVYQPLDFTNQGGFQVYWSRGGEVAVVAMGLVYGGGLIFYHVSLEGDYAAIRVDGGTVTDSQFLALSEDGTRMLYSAYHYEKNQPELRLGEVQTIQLENIRVSALAEPQVIATSGVIGANFIEDSTDILYVNERGIEREGHPYGGRALLNPDINSTWAQWVVFSPDNQYAAVLADGNLYVLPTEIDLTVR